MSASDIIIVTLGLQQEYLGAPAVAAKGFALTVREVDSNFFNLKQGVIDLDLSKAPLASPTFTGVPTAPTPSTGTNTTQLATTAFVQTGLNNLNTSISNQFSAVNEESSDLSALINTLTEEKAPINSPIFTGTVFFGNTALYQLLPSFSSTDSSNNAVPSVSYVKDKLSNLTQTVKPSILNTVNLGSSTNPFLNLFLQGNIIPYTTDTQDIGTPTKRFKDLYLSGNTLILGEANISSSLEGGVILPLNTSIGDENNIIPTNFASTTIHEAFAKTTQTTTLRLSFTAYGSIVAGSPVAINSDGTISTVNSNTAPNTSFIGIAESSAVSGNEASIAISGPVNNLSSLVTNENVFLNTDGTLTNIKSATNVKIGIATSSTEMFVFTTTGIDIYALNTSKIKLTDLSIGADNTPLNLGGISYDNTTGEFTYTPVDLGSYATTSYVDTAVANLVDSAPESLNTLNELSAALNDDANFATTITTNIGLKAPLASPTFTGVPLGPTATTGTNTTQLATTEFVQSAIGGSISLSSLSIGVDNPASGTGGITYNDSTGVFNFTPADLSTTYATITSPAFTGVPTAPTAVSGTNTTQIATTEFVQSQISASGTLTYSDFSAAVSQQASGLGSLSYDNLTGTFTYTPPFLQFSSLNNTPTTLSGYGIIDAVAADSPALTGIPTAPTASSGTNTTQIATTEYVQGEISSFSTSTGDSQKRYISSTAITEGTAVVLDSAGTVSSVAVSGQGAGSVSTLASFIPDQSTVSYDDYNNLYYCFFVEGTEIRANILTPNFGSLTSTASTPQVLIQNVTSSSNFKYVHLPNTSTGILIYNTASGYQVRLISQSAGIFTLNSPTSLLNSGDIIKDITLGPNNTPLLLIEDYNGGVQVAAALISGTTISIQAYDQVTGFTNVPSVIFYAKNKIVVTALVGSTLEYAVGTISGTTVSMNASTSVSTTRSYSSIYYHEGSGYFVLTRGVYISGDFGEAYLQTVGFDGTTLTAGLDTPTGWVQSRGLQSFYLQLSSTGPGIAFYGSWQFYQAYYLYYAFGTISSLGIFTKNTNLASLSGTGWSTIRPGSFQNKIGYGLLLTGTSSISTVLLRLDTVSNSDSWLGIAESTVLSGEETNVILAGGVADVYTGLTLNTSYYVQDNGTISTTYSDVFAGVAIASTGLQVADSKSTFRQTIQFSDLENVPTTLSGYGIVGDLDIGSSDFITTGKAYFANVFATIGDLPSAATYHGMFAHVHATGAGYFAHAGNWIEIGNKSYVDSELSLKAPLASPTFTGVPAAPTATTGTNTTQIATTAFVQTELAGLGGGNTSITISDNSPLSPSSGDLWFNSTNLTAYVYYNDGDSAQWMPVSPASGGGGGGASVTVDTTAPSSVSSGDLWFNSTNLTAYIYYNDGDSSQWVPVFPGTAGGSSGGGASVTVSDTAPISPSEGDLWYNSEYGELLIYLGNAWASAVAITPAESSWTSTTAAVTLFAGQKVLVDTSASAITLTLPASPSLGNEVRIIDATGNSATNNITVARNGSNIMGLAEDFIINIDEAAFGLVYFNASRGWVLTEK
jgi:hypothetical protein